MWEVAGGVGEEKNEPNADRGAPMKTRNQLPAALVLALSSVTAPTWAADVAQLDYTVIKSFSTLYDQSGANPLTWSVNSTDGIAWDGSGLWLSACDGAVMGKLDENGQLVDELSIPMLAGADHVAWDGTHLWSVVHSMPGHVGPPESKLVQIDTAAKEVVRTIELPWGIVVYERRADFHIDCR